MGTNYFLRTIQCDKCMHTACEKHIGKASMGWSFSFMSYDDIHSFQCWKREILDPKKLIFNEYNDPINKEWFFEMVKEKQKYKNHARVFTNNPETEEEYNYLKEHPARYNHDDGRGLYVDGEGYSFSRGEFR